MTEPTLVGHLRIDGVVDGEARFVPEKTFRGTTPEMWAAHDHLLDEDGKLPFVMGGYLVRGGDRTVLVDAGLGKGTMLGITCGAMLDNLAALGVAPEDITDVIFSHLHIDHVGWAVSDERATFANATYRCSEADWHHFMEHTKDQHDQFGPSEGVAVNTYEHLKSVQDRFEVHSGSGTLLPGIDVMSAPGHTPGSSIVVFSSGEERAMLLGDVVHCPVQLVEDDWAGLVDVDPVMARRTRNALARELEGKDIPVAGAHFPGMKLGRLLEAQGKRRWVVP